MVRDFDRPQAQSTTAVVRRSCMERHAMQHWPTTTTRWSMVRPLPTASSDLATRRNKPIKRFNR